MAEDILLYRIVVDDNGVRRSQQDIINKQREVRQAWNESKRVLKELEKAEREAAAAARAGGEAERAAHNAATQAVIAQRAAVAELAAQQRALATEQRNVATATNAQTGSLRQMEAELRTLRNAWAEMSAEQRNSTDGRALQAQIKALSDARKALRSSIGDDTPNVGNYISAFQNGIAGVFPQIGGLTSAFSSFGVTASAGMAAATGGVALLAAGFAKATQLSLAYKEALTDVQVITGQSVEDTKKLVEAVSNIQIGDTGEQIVTTYADAAKAIKLVLNASPELAKNRELAAEFTKNAIILSKTDKELPLEKSVDALSKIMKSFNKDASESGNIINALAASAAASDQPVNKVADGLIKIAGTAGASNVTLNESIALLQLTATAAGGASEAGTGLRNVFIKLSSQDLLPPNAVAQLKDAGVNIATAFNNTTTLSSRLKALAPIVKDNAALAKVFGVENIALAQRMIQTAQSTDGAASEFEKMSKAVSDGETSLAAFGQAAIAVAGSPTEKLNNIISKLSNLITGDAIANGVLVLLSGIETAIDGTIELFTPLFEALQEAGAAFTELFGAIFEGVDGMGLFKTAIQAAIVPLRIAVTAVTAVVNIFTWWFDLLKNGIINLKELYGTISNSGAFEAFTQNIRNSFPIISNLLDLLSKVGDGAKTMFNSLKDSVFGSTAEIKAKQAEATKFLISEAKKVGVTNLEDAAKYAKKQGGIVEDLARKYGILKDAKKLSETSTNAGFDPNAISLKEQLKNEKEAEKERKKLAKEREKEQKKAEKEAKDTPIKGSILEAEKLVSELQQRLNNTNLDDTGLVADLQKQLDSAKASLTDLKNRISNTDELDAAKEKLQLSLRETAQLETEGLITKEDANEKKLQAEIEYYQEVATIQDAGSKEQLDAQRKAEDLILQQKADFLKRQKELDTQAITTNFEAQKKSLELQLANETITKEAANKKRLELEIQYNESLLDITKAGSTERLAIMKKIDDLLFTQELNGIKERKDAMEQSVKDEADALLQIQDNTKKEITLLEAEGAISKQAANERKLQAEIEYYTALAAINEKGSKEQLEAQKKLDDLLFNKKVDAIRKRKEEDIKGIEEVQKITGQLVSIGEQLADIETQSQIGKLDEEYKKRRELAAGNVEAQEKLDKEYQEKKRRIEEEAFERKKAIDIAEAAINGFLGVTKAFATLDPISAAIAAIGIGITTALQIAKIKTTKFAKGTVFKGRRHSDGGIPIGAGQEVEDGEMLTTRDTSQNPRSRGAISAINKMFGGADLGGVSMPSSLFSGVKSWINTGAYNPLPEPHYRILSKASGVPVSNTYNTTNGGGFDMQKMEEQNIELRAQTLLLGKMVEQGGKQQKIKKVLFGGIKPK